MNIVIERIHRNQDSVDGILRIDGGMKICDTAENSSTSLPAGTYKVLIHRCKHYRRKMPIILFTDNSRAIRGNSRSKEIPCDSCPSMEYCGNNSTLPRFCPQIKIGNGVHKRTDGSIIIGERIIWGCMKHPVEHFNRLIDRLDKAQNRGESITLTITEK